MGAGPRREGLGWLGRCPGHPASMDRAPSRSEEVVVEHEMIPDDDEFPSPETFDLAVVFLFALA